MLKDQTLKKTRTLLFLEKLVWHGPKAWLVDGPVATLQISEPSLSLYTPGGKYYKNSSENITLYN